MSTNAHLSLSDPAVKLFRQECSKMLGKTPSGVVSSKPFIIRGEISVNGKITQLISSVEGEHWVQRIKGNLKYFPKRAREGNGKMEVLEGVALSDQELEEFDVGKNKKKGVVRKSIVMVSDMEEETPKNKKVKPTPPKQSTAPTRKQPRRSVNELPIPVLDYNPIIPTPVAGNLTLENLATLDDDTESCSTATFDNQIQTQLNKVPVNKKDREEMVQELENERMKIKKEDIWGGLDKRLAVMALNAEGKFKAPATTRKTSGAHRNFTDP